MGGSPHVDGSPGTPRRSSQRLVVACTVVVAFHVADDNFLQPSPGMSAHDHWLSGLVPLVVIFAAGVAFVRSRPGTQAVMALFLAFIGLVVGLAESGSHLLTVGLRGDDFSGLLAAGAALVLLERGAMILWRSRRADGDRLRRYARRAVFGVLGLGCAVEVGVPVAFGYIATHVSRAEVPRPELGAGYESVTLHTSDGLDLQGWYVPSRNGAAVIAFPGRLNPQLHARMLVRHGYGVLLFDRRGEGESQGDGNAFGWGGTRDLSAALDFLSARPEVDPSRIGGLGLSVGGELMLQAASEDLRLAAVVSEGAGSRTLAEELVEFDPQTVIRAFPILVAKNVAVTLFSNESPPASLVDVLARVAPRPTLLIWAPNGGNRETMNPLYQRLIGPSASSWAISDAEHMRGLQTHPAEYERRVVGFFDRALVRSPPTIRR